MQVRPIGIDLGTTYSVVACIDDSGEVQVLENSLGDLITPSVIYFENANNIVVGQTAKDARIDDPDNVVEFVKRSIGTARPFIHHGQRFDATQLSAIILQKLKADAEKALGEPITKAVVTCPAYFPIEKREATAQAAQIAGLELLALIPEPTAAAMSIGIKSDRSPGSHVLIFDLGGGTFDVTVLKYDANGDFDVVNLGGNAELGGYDFDQAIIEYVVVQFAGEYGLDPEEVKKDTQSVAELREKAQKAKHDLKDREKTIIKFSSGSNRSNIELSRAQFAELIKENLEEMRQTTQDVLADKGLSVKDIDEVILVGGSSRILAVQDMVRKLFGKDPVIRDPDKAIAVGAAYKAAQILAQSGGEASSSAVADAADKAAKYKDIVPQSIGVTVHVPETDGFENSIILARTTPLPASETRTYATSQDGQDMVEVKVNEGEDTDLEFVKEIGRFKLKLAEPRPAGSEIECTITMDENRLIKVRAYDVKGKVEAHIEIESKTRMPENKIQESQSWLKKANIS